MQRWCSSMATQQRKRIRLADRILKIDPDNQPTFSAKGNERAGGGRTCRCRELTGVVAGSGLCGETTTMLLEQYAEDGQAAKSGRTRGKEALRAIRNNIRLRIKLPQGCSRTGDLDRARHTSLALGYANTDDRIQATMVLPPKLLRGFRNSVQTRLNPSNGWSICMAGPAIHFACRTRWRNLPTRSKLQEIKSVRSPHTSNSSLNGLRKMSRPGANTFTCVRSSALSRFLEAFHSRSNLLPRKSSLPRSLRRPPSRNSRKKRSGSSRKRSPTSIYFPAMG